MAVIMKSSGLFYYIFVLPSTILLLEYTKTILATTRSQQKHAALFVFGDSPYDPGNNNFLNVSKVGYKANYPPYGETFFKNPTGRFCDGRLIPDFVALHANLPLWKPYLAPGEHQFINGANFASAGACALPENSQSVIGLGKQLKFFKDVASSLKQQLGDAEAKKLLMNAIYLSNIGGIDYVAFVDNYPNATKSQKQEYVEQVIGNITDVIKEIYKIGGRKFAFQNVAPIGCSPLFKQNYNLSKDECMGKIESLAKAHNHALVTAATELESQLPASKFIIFDYFTSILDLTSNPLKHGFKEADIACCGIGTYRGLHCGIGEYELCNNPNEYVYWDGDHVTEHANFQLAQFFWNGGTNVTAPINMKQLFELELDEIKNFSEYDDE